jgi:dUTP pyrophosphatase
MEPIKVKKLDPRAVLPTYASEYSAGADLYACLEQSVTVAPGQTVFIPTGLSMELPQGYVGLLYARSGLACKRGLAPANKAGVIDSDYRGQYMVALYNHGGEAQTEEHGDRVAQLVITPVVTPGFTEVSQLSETVRADGGFGSSGK